MLNIATQDNPCASAVMIAHLDQNCKRFPADFTEAMRGQSATKMRTKFYHRISRKQYLRQPTTPTASKTAAATSCGAPASQLSHVSQATALNTANIAPDLQYQWLPSHGPSPDCKSVPEALHQTTHEKCCEAFLSQCAGCPLSAAIASMTLS